METVPAGYDVGTATVYSYQRPLDFPQKDALTCVKCKLILRDPKQVIVCGHRYCKLCIEQMTSGSEGPYTCCIDGKKFEINEARIDRGCQKEISGLEVDCPYSCTWRGKLLDMEIHMRECLNRKLLCPLGCGGYYQKVEMEAHTSSECPKRPLWCQFCQKSIIHNSLQDHYEMCEEYPLDCDYCHEHLPNRKSLSHHLEQECEEYCMTCPQNDYSYKWSKSVITKHFLETNSISEMVARMRGMEKKMEMMEAENQQLHSEVGNIHGTFSAAVSEMNMRMQDNSIQQATATLRVRKNALSQQTELNTLKEEVIANTNQLLKMKENIQTMQDSLTRYAIAIDEIRLRQDVLDVKTTHRILIWKIPEIRRRYRDAMECPTISLYSPPFYTSPQRYCVEHHTANLYSPPLYTCPNGYRTCIRTYLNGVGIGKSIQLLLLLVLMCSEHRNLLSWPFKQSVLFLFIYRKMPAGQPLPLTYAMPPSWNHEEQDMNVASGCPTVVHE